MPTGSIDTGYSISYMQVVNQGRYVLIALLVDLENGSLGSCIDVKNIYTYYYLRLAAEQRVLWTTTVGTFFRRSIAAGFRL